MIARDLLVVSGDDATTFLQGQLSQDLEAISAGQSAWTFVLEPQGHVAAWMRCTHTDHGWMFDLDAGAGEAAEARIRRFLLRMDVTIERSEAQFACVPVGHEDSIESEGSSVVRAPSLVPAHIDVVGADIADPDGVALDAAEYEAARIRAGIPHHGAEIGEKTIPAEIGVVPLSVSFTKGCYTGQELVARIDSRGDNTPRRVRVITGTGAVPEIGDDLHVAGESVGTLTSVAASGEEWVGLAMVTRAARDATEVTMANGDVVGCAPSPLDASSTEAE